MKKKFLSILFALVLVLSLSLVTAVPVAADYAAFDNLDYYYAVVKDAPEGTKYRSVGLNPDGTKLIAQKSWNDGEYDRTEIVLMDADGTNETIISPGDSGEGTILNYGVPFWSDDGTAIGFRERPIGGFPGAEPDKVMRYDVLSDTSTYIYEPVAPLNVHNADFLGSSTTSIVFWDWIAEDGAADLFIWDGITRTNITNSTEYSEYEPVSNADGTVIVYWSGETTTEPINTTHTLTESGGTWTKDVDFTPIPDTYWAFWSGRADNYIGLTIYSTKDVAVYDSTGAFVMDLTGPGYSGGAGQWNFFGFAGEGPNGEFVMTSAAGTDPEQSRDIIFAAPRTALFVDDDGSDSSPGTEAAPFATVQKAIDEATPDGTVNVAAGTYNENINIDKSLTLEGANAGGPSTQVRDPESIINAQGVPIAVLINGAETVATFDGFTVDNYDTIGILAGAFRETLQEVPLGDDPIEVHILNNIVKPPTVEPPHNNNIQVGAGTTGTIIGNEVSGALLESPEWSGSGILVASLSDVVISYNYVHNSEGGIQILGYAEYQGRPAAEDNVIENNLVEGNECGISVQGNSIGTIIRYNDVLNNDVGIGSMAYDLSWPEHSTPSGTEVHYNNIVDNTDYGVESVVWGSHTGNVLAEEVNATNNWWDDASGPYHATTNPDGLGDTVSDNVDYDPWFGAGVEDSKSEETGTGEVIVDAKDEADTEVVKTGSGTPTITVTEYTDNPGDGAPGAFSSVGKYIDVHLDDPNDVVEIEIRNYYTLTDISGLNETSLRLSWWNGSDWVVCSDSGVNPADTNGYSGYVWAKIRAPTAIPPTIPTLADLAGTPFMSIGRPLRPAPPPGGGGPAPPDTTPPRISNVLLCPEGVTETTADICWTTHEKSTSQVEYWTSPSMLSPLDETLVINHHVELTGLTPGTKYYSKTMSMDRRGNLAVSDEYTFTTLGKPPAAAFTSSDLSISPTEVDTGEEVTISVLVNNTGNASGSYEVTLKIDHLVVASEEVTLAAGASEEITFTAAKDVAGSYSVAVNGLTGSFTVRPARIPPAPPPVAPAPPAPPLAPPPTPPPGVNWAIFGPIIGVLVFLAIFLPIRLRKRRRAA